jgi:hypothetical protein
MQAVSNESGYGERRGAASAMQHGSIPSAVPFSHLAVAASELGRRRVEAGLSRRLKRLGASAGPRGVTELHRPREYPEP